MALALSCAQAQQGLSSDPDLSEVSDQMVSACLKFAFEHHLPPLSVAVVDGGGTLVTLKRQAGSAAVLADAATLKAQSAARTREPTANLAADSQDPTVRDLYGILHVTNAAGGIPIIRGNTLIGAVAVSGAELKQDAQCAELSVDAYYHHVQITQKPDEQTESAVRRRLDDFAQQFNRRDISSVIAQYDSECRGVLTGELLDCEQYTRRVRDLLTARTPSTLRIEVRDILVVSPSVVLIDGLTYTTRHGHAPERELFSVVYRKSENEWKLVYAHSSSP